MFHRCKNLNDIKKVYRRLALLIHPDKGGDADLMILLQESYELAIDFFHQKENNQKGNKEPLKYENIYEDIIDPSDDRLWIFSEIMDYADKNPKFNMDFIKSLMDYLEKHGKLTSAQYNRAVKIYYAFKMHEKKDKS
jgi:hypothetical protein